MQLLCASDSVAFIQSLRIALESEDIAIHCSDPLLNPWGPLGPVAGAGGRIYILEEKDWERAVEILRMLDAPARPNPNALAPTPASSSLWIVLGAALAAAVIGGMLIAGS